MTAKIIEKAMAPFEKEIRACEFNIEQQNNSLARARNEEQKMYITEIIDMKEKEKEMWQMSYDHVQRIADVLTKEKFEAEVDMLYKIAANGNLEKRIENVKAICVNDTVQENVAKGIDIAISGPTFYNDEHGYMVSFGGDTYQYKDKIKSQKYKWGGGFWYKLFDSIELAEEEVSKMQEVFGGLRFEMKVNQKDIEAYERILAEEMEKKEAEKELNAARQELISRIEKPELPTLLKGTWNGKFYGRNEDQIYVDGNKKVLSGDEKIEIEEYLAKKESYDKKIDRIKRNGMEYVQKHLAKLEEEGIFSSDIERAEENKIKDIHEKAEEKQAEENKWKSVEINTQNIEADTGKAVLIKCPKKSKYSGCSYWHPARLVREGSHAYARRVSFTDDFEFKLKKYGEGKWNKSEVISEITISSEEFLEMYGGEPAEYVYDRKHDINAHYHDVKEPEKIDIDSIKVEVPECLRN